MAQSKPKSKRGGRRPGAGRKSAADLALRDDFNAAARDTIVEWLPQLLANLKTLADGSGPLNPPSLAANQYLLDRVLGKPTQSIEHSGQGGGPLALTVTLESALDRVYGRTLTVEAEATEAAALPAPGPDPGPPGLLPPDGA